jgi:serine/threonine-protein kinase
MSDLIGQIIDDRFRVDALIGQGGMGAVYKATQLSVERPVALKVLSNQGEQADEETNERFIREARHISKLSHPNIVSLIDFGNQGDFAYLVMEYVEGQSLGDLARGLCARPEVLLELLIQITSGLTQAHERALIHRDLKPDNILCLKLSTGALQIKIVDFGIARSSEERNSLETLTKEGSIVGTPEYMSPEQALGHKTIGPQSDLFSLGVIAYELITGELPFDAPTALQYLMRMCHTPHTPLAEQVDPHTWDGEFLQIIESLLEKAPEDRPASSAELLHSLQALRRKLDLREVHISRAAPLSSLFAPPLQKRPEAQKIATTPVTAEPAKNTPVLALAGVVMATVLAAAVILALVYKGSEEVETQPPVEKPETTPSTKQLANLEPTTTTPARKQSPSSRESAQATRATHLALHAAIAKGHAAIASHEEAAKKPARTAPTTPPPTSKKENPPPPTTSEKRVVEKQTSPTPEEASTDTDTLQKQLEALKKNRDE